MITKQEWGSHKTQTQYTKKLMNMYDWVIYDEKKDGFFVSFSPFKCGKCSFVWYPRIDRDGRIKFRICPKCKSKKWNDY